MKKSCFFFLAFVLVNNLLLAQKLHIKNYSAEDGLPSSQVWCSLQDEKGYIWFGTTGGLVKFDGAEFVTYSVEDGLVNNTVRFLLEDNGILWVATYNGVSEFDGNSFKNYTAKDGLGKGVVRSVVKFKDCLWFGTSEGGLSRFDGQEFITYTTDDGLPSNSIFPLLSDGKYLWIGTRGGGLSRFDGETFVNYSEKDGLTTKDVWCLIKENSILWIGTGDKGLIKLENGQFVYVIPNGKFYSVAKGKSLWFGTFDGGVWCFENGFKKYTTANGLINNRILSILVDREDSVWFTTEKGISKLVSKKFIGYLEDKIILSICMFRETLWVGTLMEGLFKFENNKLTSYTIKNGLLNNQVWVLASFKDKLWIGTYEGLNSYDGKKFDKYTVKEGLASNIITDILPIENNLWIATAGGLSKFDGKVFTNFTIKQELATNRVWSICQDGDKIWLATDTGAYCFDGNRFINYTADYGLSTNSIRIVFKDSKNVLWFGTALGINKFDGKKFTVFTTKDGLSNNSISSIVEYNGNLWLGTDKGLNIFRDEKVIKVYTQKSGLIGDESSTPNSLYLDKRQNIWFGSTKGMTKYIPENDIPNKLPPPVYIKKFFVDNTLIDQEKKLEFKHNRNNVRFSYVSLSFKDEEDVRYRYKLEGYDKVWSDIIEKREIRYTNLNNGHYTFKVRARNGDGYWSEAPVELSFVILPPFWKVWWFIGLSILGSLALIFAGYRHRINKVRKETQKLEELVRNRTLELNKRTTELEEKTQLLNELVITDELTKVYNRRFFMTRLNQDIAKMRRKKRSDSLSLIILDIDHFKKFNDKYGHRAGDYILASLAKILNSRIRAADILARYGGEEFSIILPSTDLKGAQILAEDLRQSIKNASFQFDDRIFKITISLGIGILAKPKVFNERLLDLLIKTADDALYEAKDKGRNCVCFNEAISEIRD